MLFAEENLRFTNILFLQDLANNLYSEIRSIVGFTQMSQKNRLKSVPEETLQQIASRIIGEMTVITAYTLL